MRLCPLDEANLTYSIDYVNPFFEKIFSGGISDLKSLHGFAVFPYDIVYHEKKRQRR